MMTNNHKPNSKLLFTASIIGLLLSFPVTGFMYGFVGCTDCGEGSSGIAGRLFIGLVEALLTTTTLGMPSNNEGGSSNTNLRLYVFITFIIITLLAYKVLNKKNT